MQYTRPIIAIIMANNYTTSTDAFQDMSEGSYVSSDYPQMDSFVASASRLIDLEMGRWEGFFYPTTDSVTMYYDGSGDSEQFIDEFVSISELAISEQGGLASSDYTAWASSDYMTYPYNASVKGKPFWKLIADRENQSSNITFYSYRKSVKVTGIAGYSASIPSVIAQACKMQAVRYFMRAKQGYQDTGANANVGSMTFSRLELDPDVKQLLHPLKLELERYG